MLRTAFSLAAFVALSWLIATHGVSAQNDPFAAKALQAQKEAVKAQAEAIKVQKKLQAVNWANPELKGEPTNAPNWQNANFGEERDDSPLREQDHELEAQTDRLIAKYSTTSDKEARQTIADALRDKVNEHFKVRQEIRAQELDQLKQELERLKAIHEQRNGMREQIVNDRVDQLLHDADGLGWGSGAVNERRRFNYRIYMPPEFPRSPVKVAPVPIPTPPTPPKLPKQPKDSDLNL